MGISSSLGSSALLPAGLGFRNKIINGGFDVNQRAFSSATADATFGFDRWQLATSGGTTYSAQTFALGNTIPNQEPTNHARLVTTGQSGTGVYSILSQKIEDVRTSAGQQITVSFYAKAASGTPKVAIELTQNFGTGGSPSSEVNNYFGQIVLSTSWTKYVVTGSLPSISGKTLGSASSYLRLLLWVSAGTDFNSRTGSIGIQSNTFDFWGVQLEQNYQPTPFEQRPIGVELALCQRYYRQTTTGTYGEGTIYAYNTINQSVGMSVPLPVRMRAVPSISVLGTWTTGNAGTSAPNADPYVDAVFYYSFPTATGAMNVRSSPSGYVTFSAEL